MSRTEFKDLDFTASAFTERLTQMIATHETHQVPRLKELKRYYLADNNINYRPAKTDESAADNRIASDFAKYITIFEQGYMLGKPIEYKNEQEGLLETIKEFSIQNNEDYHNVLIKTDLSIYGRAYELLYVDDETGRVKLVHLDPVQTFVVYDDTVKKNSLFGVRHYEMDYGVNEKRQFVEVYTQDAIFYYMTDRQASLTYKEQEDHYFNGVTINEYANNEERTSAYEAVLDSIDAYDLSQSELANFQQDSVDALLVIKGNPYTGQTTDNQDEDSRLQVAKKFKQARILILDDNPNEKGSEPDAFYLKKVYDSQGAEDYKKRLVSDILRFTFTPDVTDQHFAGVQSGESMKYKMMASDNRRVTQERLFAKCLMRRLRLAVNVWQIKFNASLTYDEVNQTKIIFSPNIPQNTNELIENVRRVYGIVSDETLLELLRQFTGIEAEEELERLKEEKKSPAIEPRRPKPEEVTVHAKEN